MVVLWGGGRILLSEVPLCWAYSNLEELSGPQVVPGRSGPLPSQVRVQAVKDDNSLGSGSSARRLPPGPAE